MLGPLASKPLQRLALYLHIILLFLSRALTASKQFTKARFSAPFELNCLCLCLQLSTPKAFPPFPSEDKIHPGGNFSDIHLLGQLTLPFVVKREPPSGLGSQEKGRPRGCVYNCWMASTDHPSLLLSQGKTSMSLFLGDSFFSYVRNAFWSLSSPAPMDISCHSPCLRHKN